MPNPSAVEFFFFFIEFAASNLFDDFDDSPTDRFEIGIQERITIWKNHQLFCSKIHHMPNPSAANFFMEFVA